MNRKTEIVIALLPSGLSDNLTKSFLTYQEYIVLDVLQVQSYSLKIVQGKPDSHKQPKRLPWEIVTSYTGVGIPGGTPYNGLYGEAPPERDTLFRLQVYKRVGISQGLGI